jgi:hypothetical protein
MRQTRKERALYFGGRLGDPPLPGFYAPHRPIYKLLAQVTEPHDTVSACEELAVRRLRFAVCGIGTPVRSEIGRYQTLAERATILSIRGSFGLRLRRVRSDAS